MCAPAAAAVTIVSTPCDSALTDAGAHSLHGHSGGQLLFKDVEKEGKAVFKICINSANNLSGASTTYGSRCKSHSRSHALLRIESLLFNSRLFQSQHMQHRACTTDWTCTVLYCCKLGRLQASGVSRCQLQNVWLQAGASTHCDHIQRQGTTVAISAIACQQPFLQDCWGSVPSLTQMTRDNER